jgi:hypothetical protein
MPGYSGTPLAKKLGIKPGFRVRLLQAPEDVRTELAAALKDCRNFKTGDALDFGMIFSKSCAELIREFARMEKALAPAGTIWVSWPKKSSGVATDLSDNAVREMGLEAGLVDVKVCAVTDVWSGLKFVRRVKDRQK